MINQNSFLKWSVVLKSAAGSCVAAIGGVGG